MSIAPPPSIIYGTAWKKADTQRLVTQAIALGFRGIDTACQPKHYNEAGVGDGIAAALGPGLTRADLYVQTSYLDALVLHSPLADERQTLKAWRAMEALVEQGSVKRLGISNCYRLDQFTSLFNAAHVKPVVLQNRFHDQTGHDRELRAFCRDQGVTYQSFWTLTANPQLLAHTTVSTLASRHRRTPEQIVFRYLTQIGVVPLTGTTSAQHMQDDLAIFEFTLDPEDLASIGRLL